MPPVGGTPRHRRGGSQPRLLAPPKAVDRFGTDPFEFKIMNSK